MLMCCFIAAARATASSAVGGRLPPLAALMRFAAPPTPAHPLPHALPTQHTKTQACCGARLGLGARSEEEAGSAATPVKLWAAAAATTAAADRNQRGEWRG